MKNSLSKVMILIGITNFFSSNAFAALPNVYWVSGTAAILTTPTSIKLNKAGWGAILAVPSAVSGSTAAWVQVPLAVPSLLAGQGIALNQIKVKFKGTAKVDTVDVWDGTAKIAGKAVTWTGSGIGVVTLPNPILSSGINVSLHVTHNCSKGTLCPQQSFNVISVGGVFYK